MRNGVICQAEKAEEEEIYEDEILADEKTFWLGLVVLSPWQAMIKYMNYYY